MPYWINDTRFKPFHDDTLFYGKNKLKSNVTGGINTTAIDNFREGVNLRTIGDIYNSNQVKISFVDGSEDMDVDTNGVLNHQSPFYTYGQAGDFIQYTGEFFFKDNHKGIEGTFLAANNIRFSRTVEYLIDNALIAEGLMDPEDVYPIYMNGGPQFFEEAIIEPFTIPNRLQTNESPQELATGVFAFLEAGNIGDERRFGSNNNEQMVYRDLPLVVRPYLEKDASTIIITGSYGNVIKVIQPRPSSIPNQSIVSKINPWLDEPKNIYFPKFTDTLDLLSASISANNSTIPFYSLNYGTSDGEIQTRDQKSATAGYSVYGPKMGFYGTDSVAFINRLKGS
jgi:hypothetical protein